MDDDLPSLVGASFADLLTAFNFAAPGVVGGAAGNILSKLLKGRLETTREQFFEEIRNGLRPPRDTHEADEFVAIVYRYLQIGMEGAARENLRLMARVIRGQIEHNALYASDFLRWCPVLASLSNSEIKFLGALYRLTKEFKRTEETPNQPHGTGEEMQALLIPIVFKDKWELTSAACALLRTGLLVAYSGYGGLVFRPTAMLLEIAKLAEFEV